MEELQRKIGSLFMPRLEVRRYEADANYKREIRELVERYGVLGFCVFQGDMRLTPEVLGELQNVATASLGRELVFSCDAEWGSAMRIEGGQEYPHAMSLAKTGDVSLVEEVGAAIGSELLSLGIRWCFAPVADVNSNPLNPIINIRSFGETPEEVALYAKVYSRGLRRAGVLSSAKHFPGHGDTTTDSHHALPLLDFNAERFNAIELLPFKELIADGIEAIMTGHIAAPQLARSLGSQAGEPELPATLSRQLTHTLLREQLGFKGVIVTDSLEMKAIRGHALSDAEIALAAFKAGADVLLMSPDTVGAIMTVETRICASLRDALSASHERNLRILFSKDRKGIAPLSSNESQNLSERAAREAIKIKGHIPEPLIIRGIDIIAEGSEFSEKKLAYLQEKLLTALPSVPIRVNDFDSAKTGRLLVILQSPRGRLVDDTGTTDHNIFSLVRHGEYIGVCLIGNPYSLGDIAFEGFSFVLSSFSDSQSSITAVVDILSNAS